MTDSDKDKKTEKSIITFILLNMLLVTAVYFYMKELEFNTTSFTVHVVSLGFVFAGFLHLSFLLLGSILDGGKNLFLLKKTGFLSPFIFILLFFYFCMIFYYPFLVVIISFSFLEKLGLYAVAFIFGILMATVYSAHTSNSS